MAIKFHPRPGTLLMCDFKDFKPPEMVKKRPVVIVSRPQQQLAIVVPISTVKPLLIEPCHHEMTAASMPTGLAGKQCWAKCNMITCVAFWRLDRIMNGKCPRTGKRLYISPLIEQVDLDGIRQGLRHALRL